MAILNKVYLMGNLTRDPELRYTPSGTAVCEFGIAINRRTGSANDNNRPDDTCFVDITAWDKQADLCSKFLQKGSNVFIEGRLQYDSWTDKEQKKRSRLRVVVENVQFIGSRREFAEADGGAPNEQQYRRQAPEQGAAPQQYGRQRSYAQQPYGAQQPQQGGNFPPQMPPSQDAYADRQQVSYNRTMPQQRQEPPAPPMDDNASAMNDVQGIEDDIPF